MRTVAIVGKNFGDEGKGLATDFFSRRAEKPLVVRHNGGAQSGHTVELKNAAGKSFVFHELSSGSFRNAATLWSDTYYPDLYKLGEEAERFRAAAGFLPEILTTEDTCATLPDDVLINMALEASRGDRRHGSCGMGINECDLRTRAGYGLRLGDLGRMNERGAYYELRRIRKRYIRARLAEIGDTLTAAAEEYLALLDDDNVLKNAAAAMLAHLRYVNLLTETDLKNRLAETDALIFEAGQGLLLDRGNKEYAPHLTASDTGLINPCAFLSRFGLPLDEAVYVSRAYVTKHGAGPLPCECPREELGALERDRTNEPNAWQGRLRYACHESEAAFVSHVRRDLSRAAGTPRVSLFLTHLNETGNCVVLNGRRVPAESFLRLPEIESTFQRFYLSDSRYSDDVRTAAAETAASSVRGQAQTRTDSPAADAGNA